MFEILSHKSKEHPSISPPEHHILKDETLNKKLLKNGYVVLPILTLEEVNFFKDLYKKWHPNDPIEFFKSCFSDNDEYKREVEDSILEKVKERLETYFLNFEAFGAMFVIKPKGEKGHLPVHQDWSFVDETTDWSLNSWLPLQDVNERNGGIRVLPGSHLFLETFRGSGTIEMYSHLSEEIEEFLIDLQIRAGECVFFYHGIIHTSTFNLKDEARVCLGFSIVPLNAKIYHYFYDAKNQSLTSFMVENLEFYFNMSGPLKSPPTNLKPFSSKTYSFSQITKQCLLEKIYGHQKKQ